MMMAHCTLCGNRVSAQQHRKVAERVAARKLALSAGIDKLTRKHRLQEERLIKKAGKAYEKGWADRDKEAAKEIRSVQRITKLFEKQRRPKRPAALLARAPALLRHLRKRFPKDRFRRSDRGCGIIQTVRSGGVEAGSIVYICRPESGWLEELDTRGITRFKEQTRALAGIQVVLSDRNRSGGPGIFIVSQRAVPGFAAMVRDVMLFYAKQQADFLDKQEIMGRFRV